MFRKVSTKIIAGIFVVLLAVVVLVEVIDSRNGNRTFKSDLLEVAVSDVTSIELYARAANHKLVKLFRENDAWKIEADGKTYNADAGACERLISALNDMKPKSVATTSKDRWEQFEVTDSLGTRVKLFGGSDLLADVMVGKFSYSQPRSMTSYVRLANDKEVYGVDGTLGMSVNRNVNSFRDRTLVDANKSNWTKLAFTYPADSSFVLEKAGNQWMIGEMEADSAQVAQYFNKIDRLSDSNFAEEKPSIAPTHRLRIESSNGAPSIEITGYRVDDDRFILESSQNPGSYFNSKTRAEQLFVSSASFAAKE